MDELEKTLQETLNRTGKFDAGRAETTRKEIVRMFEGKMKMVKLVTWIFLLIDGIVLVGGISGLLINLLVTKNTNAMIISAVLVLIAHEGTVLIKLWYWVLNVKYGVLKEMKQLQLQIAELTGKNPPAES